MGIINHHHHPPLYQIHWVAVSVKGGHEGVVVHQRLNDYL
jgi:hypothetical protein